MNDIIEEPDPLLGTSTLRGILLLGGVAAVAFLAYQFWYKQRAIEHASPRKANLIRIPISLPIVSRK